MEKALTTRIEKGARLSGSPANSPRIVSRRESPARSEEGKVEQGSESIHKQHDPGMRTTDFFDDTSDTTSDPARSANVSHSAENEAAKKQRLSSSSSKAWESGERASNAVATYRDTSPERQSRGTQLHPFLRLTRGYGVHRGGSSGLENTESWYVDPSKELSSGQDRQLSLQNSRIEKGPQKAQNPYSSTAVDDKTHEPSFSPQNDRILGAHAITMSALLRDEGFSRDIMSPLTQEPRVSRLFASLGDQLESKSDALESHSRKRPASVPAQKRVSLVPPPIDVHSPQRMLPEDIVRTPYPFFKHKNRPTLRRDSVLKSSPNQSDHESIRPSNNGRNLNTEVDATDCVLILSIRRANPSRAPPRISRLVIPSAANDFRSVRNSTLDIREKHFDGLGFDDAELFRRIRTQYATLTGPWRFVFARVLKRVAVTVGPEVCSGAPTSPHHPRSRCACSSSASNNGSTDSYHRVPSLRSPHLIVHSGLSDTFSESQFLLHLRSRTLGRARYAWVHWARRLASWSTCAPPSQSHPPSPPIPSRSYEPFHPHRPAPAPPRPTRHRSDRNWPLPSDRRQEAEHGQDIYAGVRDVGVEEGNAELSEPAGLEFVLGWGVERIVAAILMVLILAVAAAVLWILLGLPRKDLGTLPGYGDEGFRGAGGRVQTGCVFGILVLVVGWTGVGGWVWLSWAIM
ncbi:MAG: hypothetical protein M1821_009597 [Bathelium mastoideum]|nr:MAG: hypothetical protein M1821_009597 [Bathelium mastoideum]